MYAPLPQAPRARVEKAYFRATYAEETAGIAIGTTAWELVELNETAHSASPAPSWAKIAAAPYTADGSIIIYDPGTYDLDYRISIQSTANGGYARTRIRQTPAGGSETTMPYSQGIPLADYWNSSGGHANNMNSTKEIGTRCRQEITGITKVQIEAWVSVAGSTIGNDDVYSGTTPGEPAVFAWLTVTKV